MPDSLKAPVCLSKVGLVILFCIFASSWVIVTTTAAVKSLQSCPTLCNPIDGCPPGSPVPGILQARTLEWVAISFSNALKLKSLSRVRLFATPWNVAHQAPPPMGFSRQEYWSGVPLPSPDCHRLLCKSLFDEWLMGPADL